MEIEGLREAVIAEARERENRAAVELKLEAAYHQVADATAKRHAARTKAAAGEAVALAAIERQLREANDAVTLYSEALTIAQGQSDSASAAVTDVLAAENERRQGLAQTALNEAESKLIEAARVRERAAEALAAATQARSMSGAIARRLFAAEIAAAS